MKLKRITATLFAVSTISALAACDFSFTSSSKKLSYWDIDDVDSSVVESEIDENDYTQNLLVSNNKIGDFPCNTATSGKNGENYKQISTTINTKRVSDAMGDENLRSLGTQNILVIPVMFKNYKETATDAFRQSIFQTYFGKAEDTGWESLSSYYYKSSFGNLLLNGTVSEWFDYGLTTDEYVALTSTDVYGKEVANFDQTLDVLDKAIAWYKNRYKTDCKEFDNDNDGRIDGVWLVYSAPSMENNPNMGQKFWAYTFSKYGQSSDRESPLPFRYCWASIDFLSKGFRNDAHTIIHETGHMLGLDDYYDINGTVSPCGGTVMMDCNIGDHDSFSKFGLEWVNPYLVSGDCTIDLLPATTSGECVILPTDAGFNGSAYDEYILLELFTPDELNEKDAKNSNYGPYLKGLSQPGIHIYHIDARMATAKFNTTTGGWGTYTYTDKVITSNIQVTTRAHGNTVESNWGTQTRNKLNPNYRLIQTIDRGGKNFAKRMSYMSNDTLFKEGDVFDLQSFAKQFPNYSSDINEKTVMNDGSDMPYQVTISSLSSKGAKLTIKKL